LHVNPALHYLPEFLKATQYSNPSDSSNLSFQLAHDTDQTAFEWLSKRPENLKWTMGYMASQRNNQINWMQEPSIFSVNDFTINSNDTDRERVLMVDVGGGAGHQCMALRQAHPELKGRIVLQDLPGTIAMTDSDALQGLGIDAQSHDFMTAQAVTGAKVYYMRNILHDWPDKTCVLILKQLRAAMKGDSVIIIDEIVVQNTDSTWKQVNYDLVMMVALGGLERSKEQWKNLVSAADLKLREVIRYDEGTGDSIIVVEAAT
jgi:demethylsterigmatocystin 6-O-methyltransferase